MPYISKENGRREALRNGDIALNAGELNYQIFYYVKHADDGVISKKEAKKLYENVKNFIKRFLGDKPNYQKYNDMSGVGWRCYRELNRRLGIDYEDLLELVNDYNKEIDEYEDKKIKQNGDVE